MKAVLHSGQLEVAQDNHRFKVICAGRRWGKSVLSSLIVLQWAIADPGKYWIVSPTHQQGKEIHWYSLMQIVPKKWIDKTNDSEKTITLKNGSIISLKSGEKADNLRGSGLKGIVIDEIASLRDWNYLWKEALRPALSDYKGKGIFISTPKGYNHFYDLYMQGKSDDERYKEYKSWHFTSYDNPYIPKDEIETAQRELPENSFLQEYMADFTKHSGLVYKDFSRDFHVREIPDFKPRYYIRGLDRGFNSPTAVPIIAVNSDGDWYQIDEIYETGLINPVLAERLQDMSKKHDIKAYELSVMDSAQKSDIVELAQMNQDFIGAIKESGEPNINYVLWKINKLTQRLIIKDQKARYYVHPRCKQTIQEFEVYEWKTNLVGNEEDNPLKENDHMMDALGDLNAMYLHQFDEKRKPWADKVPGTYIEPAIKDEDENDWGGTPVESYD